MRFVWKKLAPDQSSHLFSVDCYRSLYISHELSSLMLGRVASVLTLVTPTGVIPASERDRLVPTKSVRITLNVLARRGKRGGGGDGR